MSVDLSGSTKAKTIGLTSGSENGAQLFPAGSLPSKAWAQFRASGFEKSVCGVIYRKDAPAECGVPMGGVSTGCVDIDTDGTFGYSSIFGSYAPAGRLQHPFLGITAGDRAWVLSMGNVKDLETVLLPSEIHYWGHYPVADLEYETTAPVGVGLRAWSPFIPGDVQVSNTPGAVFEVRLRNLTDRQQSGKVTFSFPGPSQAEAQVSGSSPRQEVTRNNFRLLEPIAQGAIAPRRTPVVGKLNGVTVESGTGVGYTLGVIGDSPIWTGTAIGPLGGSWARDLIDPIFPNPATTRKFLEPRENDLGTSLAVEYSLPPRGAKTVRFVLSWYSPIWKGEGDHVFTQMYSTRYPNSRAVAEFLAENHESLLARILNWQQEIYSSEDLPVWLRETLVNNLYLITETSLWAAAKPSVGEWCRPEDGLFAMNESPRQCPQMECIPCSFYGNIPVVYFFPNLALSTLRTYKAYQFPDGAAPWIFGGWTDNPHTEGVELAMPSRGYQTPTNGIAYAAMVDRYLLSTGSQEVLREFYPSVKKNMVHTMNLNPGPDGVVSMPTGNIDPANGLRATEWVENDMWYGMTVHVGGLHLAQLRIVERMAEEAGDKDFAARCREWFKQGSESMESKMWNGNSYLSYYEPSSGKKSDRIFSCQLDGDWIALFHGLKPVFREDRAKTVLSTVREKNAQLSPYGAVMQVNQDGTPWEGSAYSGYAFFIAEQYMLAMTYMYNGEMEFGLEQTRRCLENLISKGYTWNLPCWVEASTGARGDGFDYYQLMMLWSLPAALARGDLRRPLEKDGLVDRVIKAGAKV